MRMTKKSSLGLAPGLKRPVPPAQFPCEGVGLAALPQQPPLVIEHMKEAAEYDPCRKKLVEVGAKIGVSFGS